MKKLFLQTFGCQMNERDSEGVQGLLLESGYEVVPSPEVLIAIKHNRVRP